MEIVRDQSRKILRVSQSGYVSKILNNFIIDNGKSVQMPLGRHFKLSLKDYPVRDYDVERMSKVPYVNAVGSLMYLVVCTRPDIAYSVSVVSRYLANPDYAKDPNKGRSITGYAFLVHGCVVSWKATLQHVMALSTIEAEYTDLTKAVKEAIWLKGLLEKIGIELNTVHINVHYHFIREVLEAKTVKLLKAGTEHNAADALTKVLVASKDKEVSQAARDSDDTLVCCVENTVKDRIMDSGASFHATYCRQELERFKLCSGKVRLVDDKTLDFTGVGDVVFKTSFGTSWIMKDVRIGMSMLASKGNVSDVRKVDIYFCKPGSLGKQKNLSFIMSVNTRKLQSNRSCDRYNVNLQVKCLKFDNGGEYKSMGIHVEALKMLWAYSFITAYLIYRIPYILIRLRIPEEGWRGKDTSLTHLKDTKSHQVIQSRDITFVDSIYEARSATNSSSLTKPIQKSQVVLVDIPENLAKNDIIVAKHGLSSKITQIPGGSSDTSKGSKNSGSFENNGRSDEEYSEDGASSKEGGSKTLQVRKSTRESRAPVSDVHQVGDEREAELLCSFNWPPSELITDNGVLPERKVREVALFKGSLARGVQFGMGRAVWHEPEQFSSELNNISLV
uniref:Retrovirus-related Pol polyprotein from transposon TNT 1-94-like beta-barrel domain-containing protein n=1 Tax=Tanacetum cinerariifolium TaxID=118510 RepID=A0A699GTW6_TANCI|nr:hypothetical protein [Tanacetum cinerariifolium]